MQEVPEGQVKMAKKLSDEEIDFINNLDDEFPLLNVPVGYDIVLDNHDGIKLRKNRTGAKALHIAG